MTPELAERLAALEEQIAQQPHSIGVIQASYDIADPYLRLRFLTEMVEKIAPKSDVIRKMREIPVDCRTFLEDEYFLGGVMRLWPAIKEEVIEASSGKYVEAVFTGSIGTGKTTAALAVLIYSLYRVLLLRDPHAEFDMDPSSEISFVLQSVTGGTAYSVDYMRLRRTLEASPWFQTMAPHDRERKASIRFLNSVVVVEPLPGTETAAIGENVMGGLIDEVNHMKVIQNSSRTRDGAAWDQMLENYRAIARRRESRFMRGGKLLGMLCLVGSANYAGQFTDRKKAERDRQLRETGETNIYIYDKRQWEVQPEGRFSKERFNVFLGDGTRKPRILDDGEKPAPGDLPYIMPVPLDLKDQFKSDLAGAVKDIAGIALHGFSKFISNYQAIHDAFGPRHNLFIGGKTNFDNIPCRIAKGAIVNPTHPRYIHVDLSLAVDYAALSMGHVSRFVKVDRGGGMVDTMPEFILDGLLSIEPVPGSQIPIHKIKKIVFVLRDMGYDIQWVSLDGFQSADFIQTMRGAGIRSGVLSLDKTPDAYMTTKQALLDGRVIGPENDLIKTELEELVWVSQNTKVDHPPEGSKDLSDTVAGVVHGLTMKRTIWLSFGVDPRNSSVMDKKPQED